MKHFDHQENASAYPYSSCRMRFRLLALLYAANALVAVASLVGLYVVWESASLPSTTRSGAGNSLHVWNWVLNSGESGTASERVSGAVVLGDTIHALDGQTVHSQDELTFLLNAREPGDTVTITSSNPGLHKTQREQITTRVALVHTYTLTSLGIRAFAGLIYLVFGLLILIRRSEEMTARMVNSAALAAAVVVLDTWGFYGTPIIGVFYRCLFFFAYGFVPIFLLNFGLIFPKRLLRENRNLLVPLYTLALALAVYLSFSFTRAVATGLISDYDSFASVFAISEWLFGAITLTAFVAFSLTYVRSTERSERKKIRWVLFGISFSALFYFFFEELPQMFGTQFLVSEDIVLLSSTIAPVTFAIAIIRYHVLDIDALLNRASVYLGVGGAVFALYAVLLVVATALIGQISPVGNLALSSGTAILTAILFEPLRQRVQRLVDKTFFRVRYNYREAHKQILLDFSHARSAADIARSLITNIDNLLKTKWSSATILSPDGTEPLVESMGELPQDLSIPAVPASAIDTRPRGRTSDVEPGAHFVALASAADSIVVQPALLLALRQENGDVLGTLALGPKKSGQKITIEDVDLVESVARQAALAIERSLLAERLFEEQAESRKQKQLNALKSQFVSSVSHDLKTPITSIKLFVQLLEMTRAKLSADELEYLRIIDGESDRLKTLIDNVLDHARIERGVMEYHFAKTDLNTCIHNMLAPLKYLIDMQGFNFTLVLTDEALPIEADTTALHTSLTNILSNAIKYSGDKKAITVRSFSDDEGSARWASVEISDSGTGISERDLTQLFEPFFRSSDVSKTLQAPGTGLGLANVKHAIDAHRGKISISSKAGIGTTVTIRLPLA